MDALVLAGGAGSRFWPASRRARPKPFVPLVGGQTLLDATLGRLSGLTEPSRIRVLASRDLEAVTREALVGHPGVRALFEPVPRNTAAAIAWGAACVAAEDPDAIVGVFPADHHIPSPAGFLRTLAAAEKAAAHHDALVLIGIEPAHASTAYGYLRVGDRALGPGGVHRIREFREKPAAAVARRLVRSGEYLWNAGMVVAPVRRILAECQAHAPEVWDALGPALERTARGEPVETRALDADYAQVKPLSFDYAVLERTDRALVARGRFRWSDLGSWDSLEPHLDAAAGNRVRGRAPVVNIGASGNVVWNQTGRALALVGIEDLIVVETEDVLLICRKDRAQDVRAVVEKLEDPKFKDLA